MTRPARCSPTDSGASNTAFMAIEPVRAAQIAFSEPYVIIEGLTRWQTTRLTLRWRSSTGRRCALRSARRRVRSVFIAYAAAGAAGAGGYFRRGDRAVFRTRAGGGGRRASTAAGRRGRPSRLPSAGWHFTAIRRDGGAAAKTQGAAYVNAFIERCKANGLVKAALQRSGRGEVTVAPPAASA